MTQLSIRGVLHSVARVSGAYVVNGLLGVLFIPVALRKLGDIGYAALSVYGLALSYLVLCELGVGKNLLREIAAADDEASRLAHVHRALSAYMVISLFVVSAAPIAAWAVPRWVIPFAPGMRPEVELVVLLAVVEYLLGIVVALHNSEAMARERIAKYARFQAMSGVLRYGGGLAVLLLLRSPTPALVCAAFAARRLIEIPLAMHVMGRLPVGTWRTWRPSFRVAGTLARSTSLSLAQLLQTSMISAGSVLIGHSAGPAALGVFRAAFDLASKLWFISGAFALVLFPRFARLQASEAGRQTLATVLPAALTLSAALLTMSSVSGVLLSSPVLQLLGLRGEMAWAIFALSLSGVALHAQATIPFELLLAGGRFPQAAVITATGLAMLLIVFMILSGGPPLVGLGWAWFLSQAVFAARCRRAMGGLLLGNVNRRGRLPIDELLATCSLGAGSCFVLAESHVARTAWAITSVALVCVMLRRVIPALTLVRTSW